MVDLSMAAGSWKTIQPTHEKKNPPKLVVWRKIAYWVSTHQLKYIVIQTAIKQLLTMPAPYQSKFKTICSGMPLIWSWRVHAPGEGKCFMSPSVLFVQPFVYSKETHLQSISGRITCPFTDRSILHQFSEAWWWRIYFAVNRPIIGLDNGFSLQECQSIT